MTERKNREFVTVEELSRGFSEYALEQSRDLEGKCLVLCYEDGRRVSLRFLQENTLICSVEKKEPFSTRYTLLSPRPGFYYMNFICAAYGDIRSVATVLDLGRGIATTCVGTLPSREEASISQFERGDRNLPLTSVRAEFFHAAVDADFGENTPRHLPTAELVGERVQFTYSGNDVYEHIYLNPKFYTWQCLKGIEKGLCDTDRCWYYKIGEGLYWFVWAERVVPTLGSVVEDFQSMRSHGMLYGYEDYGMGRVKNFPVGSYARVLNKTEHII